MDFHATLARLTRHPTFTDWHNSNKDAFLAHGFLMLDEANKDTWQIGFYNPKTERMTTFHVSPDTVKKTEDQEVLKKEGDIEPLQPEHVKINAEDALQTAKTCFAEHYKGEKDIKHFFILQNTEGHHLYNITYFTQSLKTINIKIDAQTGDIIKHSKQDLAMFG